MTRARKTAGRITFVGAGPGDPGLLTVRAADASLRGRRWWWPTRDVPRGGARRCADGAEVRRPAERRAGRRAPRPCSPTRAAGTRVVRLVAGDPFTDGRVVKEALGRRRAPPCRSTSSPASPSAPARAAYAGVPLGAVHTEADVRRRTVDCDALAAAPGTLVLTVDRVADLAAAASRAGRERLKPDTPVAVTARRHRRPGSRPWTPAGVARAARRRRLTGPLVVTVGKAAAGSGTSWPGGSRARCTAGRCWCRAPRSRPAR